MAQSTLDPASFELWRRTNTELMGIKDQLKRMNDILEKNDNDMRYSNKDGEPNWNSGLGMLHTD